MTKALYLFNSLTVVLRCPCQQHDIVLVLLHRIERGRQARTQSHCVFVHFRQDRFPVQHGGFLLTDAVEISGAIGRSDCYWGGWQRKGSSLLERDGENGR